MTFLYPAAFFFTLVLPAIVLLYLRRPSRREQEVSSLFFWKRIWEQSPRRRFLGRLRNLLSLLLALIIGILLLLALARPEFFRPPGKRHTVVVMDLRARMQAGSAFAESLAAARQLVAGAGTDEEVALLGVAGTPQVISPFSSDSAELRRLLSLQSPTDGGGSLEDTLRLARLMLSGREGQTRLVLLTDRPVPEATDAEIILTGRQMENAAILALAQRPLPASPQSSEILVKLGNFSRSARELEFELNLDGLPIDLRSLPVEAGGEADFTIALPKEVFQNSPGLLTAKLTADDPLRVDNTARTFIPSPVRLRVLLLTPGNPYLENALKADPGVSLEILTSDLWREGMGSNFDVVVWDDNFPTEMPLSSLGPGNFLFLGSTPFTTSTERTAVTHVEVMQADSPLLWNVDFSRVNFAALPRMSLPEDSARQGKIVLQSAETPLIVSAESPSGGRLVATAFGVSSSDFPLKAGFPLFINNAIYWLDHQRDAVRRDFRAGETFQPAPGSEINTSPRDTGPGAFTSQPMLLRKNGFYETRTQDASGWIAVNTANAEESDLRTSAGTGNPILTAAQFGGLQVWQWFGLAALGLILLEWAAHHRRITE